MERREGTSLSRTNRTGSVEGYRERILRHRRPLGAIVEIGTAVSLDLTCDPTQRNLPRPQSEHS